MAQIAQNTEKRRATPVAEVYSNDGTKIIGALYRWNTGEEEVLWDKDMLYPTDPFQTQQVYKLTGTQ